MIVLYVLLAVVILLLMIMIHETGHYLAGKMLKFKIEEFSIGFGKAIFSKKLKSGEMFSLRWVPLGGYCAFKGEDEEGNEDDKECFNNYPCWKRLIVLFSGAFFNFLSAIIFSFISAIGTSDKNVSAIPVASTSKFMISLCGSHRNASNLINLMCKIKLLTKTTQNIKVEKLELDENNKIIQSESYNKDIE